ncbi:TPA: hypothetical protein ACQ2HS_001998 [Klebsiella pneumoniae]|uniref:hypothetical protein n=1 Tax=Klebsiella pneumoniae TaxID=573 RepID=UPI0035B84B5B
MSKYTQGKWAENQQWKGFIIGEDGKTICQVVAYNGGFATRDANTARILACVNAFEGIDTDRIAGKSLGEFLAGELYLNKAEPKPDGGFGFTFSGLAVQLMAESFADQLKQSGAVNYLELLFEHAEIGPLTVTMQRVEGLTPAQKLAKAEAQRDELMATLLQTRIWVSGEASGVETQAAQLAILDHAIARAKGGAA